MIKTGKLKKFVVLIVLDGFGINRLDSTKLNFQKYTPKFNKLVETYPATVLINPLDKETLLSNDDICSLSHFMIGTSRVENDVKTLEKINPLSINSLSKILSQNNLKQLYLSDAEKFPQVSYFYRGCFAKLFAGEKQIICAKKIIKKNSDKPQLHIKEIYLKLKNELSTKLSNFIFINLSNIDVVANSANDKALVKSVKAVDKYLGLMIDKILAKGGEVLIISDHNKMTESGDSDNFNMINKVPLVVVGKRFEGKSFPKSKLVGTDLSMIEPTGFLTDIAPTILSLLNLQKPKEMIGRNLI
jgi:2,3-bisphosphoglycerate-independent phosphoglycerate mutase